MSKKERRRILDVLVEQGSAGKAVEPPLETIDRVDAEVKKLEKLLSEKVEGDRVVELLLSIPGTGLITAATVRGYVDDISRFWGYKQFSAYAGLMRRVTCAYRLMYSYQAMKPYKGSGKTIIATARKLSKIVWFMLRNDEPFDPGRMTDPSIRKTAFEMRAAAAEAAA